MFSLIMHMCITCNTGKKHPEAESDMMQCSSNVLELDCVSHMAHGNVGRSNAVKSCYAAAWNDL